MPHKYNVFAVVLLISGLIEISKALMEIVFLETSCIFKCKILILSKE